MSLFSFTHRFGQGLYDIIIVSAPISQGSYSSLVMLNPRNCINDSYSYLLHRVALTTGQLVDLVWISLTQIKFIHAIVIYVLFHVNAPGYV